MKKTCVVYSSKYGTTKQYAQWIAEELAVPLFEASNFNSKFSEFEQIIFGGGLYAGGIKGFKKIFKDHSGKGLILFTVGLADPQTTDYAAVLKANLSQEQLNHAKIFHLRGGIDYPKMTRAHQVMMAFKKKQVEKEVAKGGTQEHQDFLASYGKQIDFTDKAMIKPLIDYIRRAQ